VTVNAQTVGGDPSLLLSFSRLQSVYKLIRLTYDRDDAQAPPAASFTIREMFGANESTTNFRERSSRRSAGGQTRRLARQR
jgi:hypothetical protein